MTDTTTIEITTEQKQALDDLKVHDSEAYKSVIGRLIDGDDQDNSGRGSNDLREQLDRIEAAATTAEERTGTIERTLDYAELANAVADELEVRLR